MLGPAGSSNVPWSQAARVAAVMEWANGAISSAEFTTDCVHPNYSVEGADLQMSCGESEENDSNDLFSNKVLLNFINHLTCLVRCFLLLL